MAHAPEVSGIKFEQADKAGSPVYYSGGTTDIFNPSGWFDYPYPYPAELQSNFDDSPFADPVFLRIGEISTNAPSVVNIDPATRLRRSEIQIQKEIERAVNGSLRHLARAVFSAAKFGTSYINYIFDAGGRWSRIESIPPQEMIVGASQREKGLVYPTGHFIRFYGTGYADSTYLNAAMQAELFARERIPLLPTMNKKSNNRWCDKLTSSLTERSTVYGRVNPIILQIVKDYKAGADYLATQMKTGWRKDLFLKLYGRGFDDKEPGLTSEIREARAEARRKLKQLVSGETRWIDVLLLYDVAEGSSYLKDDLELIELDVKQSIDQVVKGYLDNLERLFFQFYGVPKALLAGALNTAGTLGDSMQTFFAYESFIIGMIQPFQEQLESCLNRFIRDVYGDVPLEIHFQRVEIEPKAEKVKRFQAEVAAGIRTANEIRQMEYGLPEIIAPPPPKEAQGGVETASPTKSIRSFFKWN